MKLLPLVFLLASTAFAQPAPVAPRTTTVRQASTGAASVIVLDGTQPFTTTPGANGKVIVTQGAKTKTFPNSNPLTVTYFGSWPKCPNKPPIATRTLQCPTGFTGTWTQTQDWAPNPYPTCWTVLPWQPTSPPAGACTPITPPPPPPGTLVLDLSYVNQASPEFARFKGYVDRAVAGNRDYGFSATDAAYMFKLTGGTQYRDLAVSMVEDQVASAEARIAAGQNPSVAGDSYLEVGGMLGDLSLVYVWCNSSLTASQKTRWAAYANQAIYNVWHPAQASWGGRSAPWSGWAVNDPANNYYYSFMRATEYWALATNDTALLTFLRTDRWPLLTNFYATIPGGGSLEGSGYGVSHKGLFELYQVWHDSGQGDLANLNTHLTNSILVWAHSTVPTLNKFHPSGDQSRVSEPVIYDYQRTLVLQAYRQTNNAGVAADGAWWLSHISDQNMQNSFNYRFNLIPVAPNSIPPTLSYRAPETGFTFSRTGWDTNATWVGIVMGTYNQSHAHQEQGGFTLYKGTWLAVTNNIWSRSGINQSTIDKNVVRFERNSAVVPQRQGQSTNVTNYSAAPNGDLHITGNLTPFYASGIAWTRTLDFVGGALTVTDDMALASGTSAVWQVNVPVQPSVSGNTITAGALTITIEEPAAAQIDVVDMRTINVPGYGFDYNSGWRVDVRGSATRYRAVLRAN